MKIFSLLLSLCIITCCHAQSLATWDFLEKINLKINLIEKEKKTNIENNQQLIHSILILQNDKKIIDSCIYQQKNYIHDFEKLNIPIPKNIPDSTDIQNTANQFSANIRYHQAKLTFCEIIQKRIERTTKQLHFKIYHHQLQNIKVPYSSLMAIISKKPPFPILNSFSSMTKNAFYQLLHFKISNLYIIMICFIGVFLSKKYQFYDFFNQNISYESFFFKSLVFLLTENTIFIILRFNYDVSYNLENIPALNSLSQKILSLFYFYFILNHFQLKPHLKDYLKLLLSFISIMSLCYFYILNFNGNYELFSWETLLYVKYLFFISIFVSTYVVVYWTCQRILVNSKMYPTFKKNNFWIQIILLGNLILGVMGRVDIGIFIQLNFIITLYYVVTFYIFYITINNSIHILNNASKQRHFDKYNFVIQKLSHSIMEFKTLAYFSFILILTRIIVFMLFVWFLLSPELQDKFYQFSFKTHSIYHLNWVIAYSIRAINIFLLLNLSSRIIAAFLSEKIFDDPENSIKIEPVLYSIGCFLSILITLKLAGMDLQNLSIILSGLLFGIGISLRTILGQYISGIILLISKTYKVGDFISTNNFKGYIKNIGFMETQIESPEKTTLIIPNYVIVSSVVESFHLYSNEPHQFHIRFSFKTIDVLPKAKKLITDYLNQNKKIVLNQKVSVPIILQAPSITNYSFDLDIICETTEFKELTLLISQIQLELLEIFQKNHIDAQLSSESNPSQ